MCYDLLFSLNIIFFISNYVHMCCYSPFIFNILLLTDKRMLRVRSSAYEHSYTAPDLTGFL